MHELEKKRIKIKIRKFLVNLNIIKCCKYFDKILAMTCCLKYEYKYLNIDDTYTYFNMLKVLFVRFLLLKNFRKNINCMESKKYKISKCLTQLNH